MDWRTARPLHLWLFIKADRRVKKTRGGIELPDQLVGIERVMEGTGRVMKVGDRDEIRKKVGFDFEPGQRVCYRGFLKDAHQPFDDEKDGQSVFLLRAEDILAVIEDEDIRMGAFS